MWRPDVNTNPNAKIGFTTYAMWGLCFVVIGVCYALEANDAKATKTAEATTPSDVQRVLPSGAWLMRDGSIKAPDK